MKSASGKNNHFRKVPRTEPASQNNIMPVTFAEFAKFIKSGEYFNATKHWRTDHCLQDGGLGEPCKGGDEVLRCIGYGSHDKNAPVVNVTYYEAQAYCNFMGARLPWYDEALRISIPDDMDLWCGEWFNPAAPYNFGRFVPQNSSQKRVRTNSNRDIGSPPWTRDGNLGFLVWHL